jgi:hypothetical protein
MGSICLLFTGRGMFTIKARKRRARARFAGYDRFDVAIQVVLAGYWPGWSVVGIQGVPLKRPRRASSGSMCHLAAVER